MIFDKCKKFLCLGLCAAMLLSASGCNDGGGDEGESKEVTSVAESSTTPVDRLNMLDKLDGKYAGREYRIVTTALSLFKNTDKGETPLDKAVEKRLQLISQSLDVAINVKEMSEKEIEAALKNKTLDAHLVCASSRFLAEMADKGYLENMTSLPYFDPWADYAPKDELGAQTVSGKMYTASSPATLSLSSAIVVFYDKALIDSTGIDPVKAVNDGTWTWSKLASIAQSAYDINPCIGIDALSDSEEVTSAIYASSGNRFVSGGEGTPSAAYSTSAAGNVNNINALLFNNSTLCPETDEDAALKSFIEGKTAFLVARLDNVVKICGDKKLGKVTEWGILPLPKHSEAQLNYYSPISSVASVMAVPKGCEDSAFAGFMLNALYAASTDNLDASLKSTYINYYFWSNDSAVMLDKIEETLHYDIGILYSSLSAVGGIGTDHIMGKESLSAPTEDDIMAFDKWAEEIFG